MEAKRRRLLLMVTVVIVVVIPNDADHKQAGTVSQTQIAPTPNPHQPITPSHNPNSTSHNVTGPAGNHTSTPTLPTTPKKTMTELPPVNPKEESASSLTIFFILIVVAICILLVHLLIKFRFKYLPESVTEIFIGGLIGLILWLIPGTNWTNEERLQPTVFFLILLPPILFESGYSLHKGNFFQNIGSILVFAVLGTAISAFVIGGGLYLLGQTQVIYQLSWVESMAFGSLISAVDPVATLAIFSALNIDPVLNMLVFGESILNDAVSIVMTNTVIMLNSKEMADVGASEAFFYSVGYFLLLFTASSAIGIATGLVSALMLKHIDMRKTPSLELGLVLIFSYLPYVLAEGIKLSGIMAILFAGITMSHYTHHNLSPITQITVQQTFRTLAFMAETCIFAYLGLALFSFKLNFKPAFVIWSIVLLLVARAVNIFPLSFMVNYFRDHKITRKMAFIMWFSGLRGAIAYSLSLHLDFSQDTRVVLLTTTLCIVLFTVLVLGGSTLPLLKCMERSEEKEKGRKKKKKDLTLSKTEEIGGTIDTEHLSELTEEEYEVNYASRPHLKGFVRIDTKYFIPFFTRRLMQEDIVDGHLQMKRLLSNNKWYNEVLSTPSDTPTNRDPSHPGGANSLYPDSGESLHTDEDAETEIL